MTQPDLTRQIYDGLTHYTAQTGLELKPEWLRLHVHPDQVRDWFGFARTIMLNVDKAWKEKKIFGIAFVEDAAVEYGHPVLKSTWEITL